MVAAKIADRVMSETAKTPQEAVKEIVKEQAEVVVQRKSHSQTKSKMHQILTAKFQEYKKDLNNRLIRLYKDMKEIIGK